MDQDKLLYNNKKFKNQFDTKDLTTEEQEQFRKVYEKAQLELKKKRLVTRKDSNSTFKIRSNVFLIDSKYRDL